MESPRSPSLAPLIAAVIVAAALAGYLDGYLLLGKVGTLGGGRVRTYQDQWQAHLFTPAAVLESHLIGRPVYLGHKR